LLSLEDLFGKFNGHAVGYGLERTRSRKKGDRRSLLSELQRTDFFEVRLHHHLIRRTLMNQVLYGSIGRPKHNRITKGGCSLCVPRKGLMMYPGYSRIN
jgi:hypothetical protein